MKVALEYGVLRGRVDAQIAFYRSVGVSHIILGAWATPGYQELNYLSPEALRAIQEPLGRAGISIDGFWYGENNIRLMMDPDKGEGVVARFFRSLDTLKAFGVGLAPVMNVIPAADASDRKALWGRMVELYKRLIDKAERCGVAIATHTHWTPDRLVWNTDTLLELLDAVPSERNTALFCAGSLWSAGDAMTASVERLAGRIGMVHFRDSRERTGRCEEMPLGTGETEFRDVVAALERTGYRGLIRPEHVGTFPGERDRTASMAMAVGFLRGILHALNIQET